MKKLHKFAWRFSYELHRAVERLTGYEYHPDKRMYARTRSECCNAPCMTVVCDEENRLIDQRRVDEILLHMKTAKKIIHFLTYGQRCTKCNLFPALRRWDFKNSWLACLRDA